MNNQRAITGVSLSLISLFALVLVAMPSMAQQSDVAIKVNGEVVKQSQLDQRIERSWKRMKTQYGERMKNEKMKKRMRKRVRQQVIDQTVEELLLRTNAKESDVSVQESEIDGRIQSQKQRFQSEEQFKKALENKGITIEDYRQRVRKDLLVQKFLDQKLGDVSVSEGEAREYYTKNKQQFKDSSFEEVKSSIERILKRRKQQKKRQQLVDNLREKSEVDIRV